MTEQETKTRLNDYLDGELSPAQVSSFEDALSKDPALRAELESVQAALEILRTEGPLKAPDGFHERVMAQAAVEPMPQVGWLDRVRSFFRELPMETLAMAVAAAIVLVLVGNLIPDSEEPATEPAAMQPAEGELSTATGAQDKKDVSKSKEAAPPAQAEKELDPIREVANGLITGPVDDSGGAEASKTASYKGEPASKPETAKGSDVVGMLDLGAKSEVSTGSTSGTDPGLEPQEVQAIDLEAQLNAAVAYSLVVKDSSSLRQIAALAERHGGRAVNAKTGAALSDSDLDGGRVQVQVRIPPAQLASFHAALGSVGAAQRTSMNDANLYGPDTISLNLDVRLK
jgi:negative regulator of sigma E activity